MCRSRRSSRIGSMRIWSPSGSSTYRSGCEPRCTRPRSPSTSTASSYAARRLPTPVGPWKRYACATPSARAARSRRLASSCSGSELKLSADEICHLLGRSTGLDRDDPLGEALGQLAVGRIDARAELAVFALDPVGVAAGPPRGRGRVDQQQERAVRQNTLDGGEVELEHRVQAEPTRDPLVGERRVDVPVADDVRPTLPRWGDQALGELGAGRREQRRLGPAGHVRPVQEQLTDPLAELRAARLPGDDDLAPRLLQVPPEELDLRRLAGAVEALERHEHPGT